MIDPNLFDYIPSLIHREGKALTSALEVCTDSRTYNDGELFLALNGPNHRGIGFVETILSEHKCPAVACEVATTQEKRLWSEWTKSYPETLFLQVTDSLLFYQQLATAHLKQWKKRKEGRLVAAITGSSGKTTTKEMLTFLLEGLLGTKLLSTEKNYNNHIGVPRTLLRLTEEHDFIIVEMGMNHPGELAVLCDMALPDAGIISNIGLAHIEFFESQEGIFHEKKTLYDAVMKNTKGEGHMALCSDDPFLNQLPKTPNISFWSKSGNGDEEWIYSYSSSEGQVSLKRKEVNFELRNAYLVGEHNFFNLTNSFLLSYALFPERVQELIERASHFKSKDNRGAWIVDGERHFYLDAYNANPESMKAALKGIMEYYERFQIDPACQFFVIGDMYELGEKTEHFHRELGHFIGQLGIRNVAFIGRFGQFYKAGLGGECIVSETKEEFMRHHWPAIRATFKYIFIKASRGLALESLIH